MLYNPRLQRVYDVRDDIPVMLIDEARAVDDAEAARLQARIDAEGIAADVRRPPDVVTERPARRLAPERATPPTVASRAATG